MKKRLLSILTLSLMLLSLFSVNVFAANETYIATAQINVYKNTACTTRGTCSPSKAYNAYISKNDDVNIQKLTSKYAKVDYPTSLGRKTGYITRNDYNNKLKKGDNSQLLFPLKGSITRSSNTKTNGYYCDYKTGGSKPVYAPADGRVVFKQAYRNKNGTKKLSSYGNFVEFTSSDGTYKVKCCHLTSFNGVSTTVKSSLSYPCSGSDGVLTLKTKTVKKGELLGYSGYTGNASGHHLHIEVYKNGKAQNPANIFKTWN